MRLFRCLLAVLVALPCAGPLHAAPPSRAEVARYARQLLVDSYPADGPGAAVLVARGDTVLFRGARGESDLAQDKALRADDLFEVGSMTKQFTAAGVLKLVEAGKVSLDDPLSKYVKDVTGGDRVTVRELLNHTAGLKDYTEIPGWIDSPLQQDLTTPQLVATFRHQPPEFAPGTDWRYDNSGYVLLGAIIESVTAESWHAYLQQALFKPLGLTHTGYGDDPAFALHRVKGYASSDGRMVPARPMSLSQASAAGGLVSNVDDLLTWNLALHGGRVLDAARYRDMVTPSGKALDAHYGYGLVHETLRGTDMLQHGGSIFGYSSYLIYLPRDALTVVVLNNQEGEIPRRNDAETIARRLAAYSLGKPYPEGKATKVAPAMLKTYEGVYRIDEHTDRIVRVVDGVLTSQRTGGARFALVPVAADQFVFDGQLSRVAFDRSPSGAVTGMRYFLNDEGDGAFAVRSDAPLPVERIAIALPKDALERVVGTYRAPELSLRVFLSGDALQVQLEGQPPAPLFAASPDTFFLTVPEATLDFAPADAMPHSVTLRQGGETIVFNRAP